MVGYSSEDAEQIAVMDWANWHMMKYPELKWLFHCPNGGKRNKVEAARFQSMGVKSGISDLILPAPKGIYHGLFLELKYGNGKVSKTQIEFLTDMFQQGYFTAVCYGSCTAINVLEKYCNLKKNQCMDLENNCIWTL